jgi:hypothetical protein
MILWPNVSKKLLTDTNESNADGQDVAHVVSYGHTFFRESHR